MEFPAAISDKTHAGEDWVNSDDSYTIGDEAPWPVRRITCYGPGDLYLLPLDGSAEKLWGTVPDGAVISQFCRGVGASTTVPVVVLQR